MDKKELDRLAYVKVGLTGVKHMDEKIRAIIERPALPKKGNKHQIKSMTPRNKAIARLLLAGKKPAEIAKHFSVTKQIVSRVINSDIFIEYYDGLERMAELKALEFGQELRVLGKAAVGVKREDLDIGPKEKMSADVHRARKLRADAATDVLDRIPETSKRSHTTSESKHLHLHQHEHIDSMSEEKLRDFVFGRLGPK